MPRDRSSARARLHTKNERFAADDRGLCGQSICRDDIEGPVQELKNLAAIQRELERGDIWLDGVNAARERLSAANKALDN